MPSVLATDPIAAAEAANALGYPVVVKLAADEIEHKSDIGGVKVGLRDPAEVMAAYADVVSAGREVGADVSGRARPAAAVGRDRAAGRHRHRPGLGAGPRRRPRRGLGGDPARHRHPGAPGRPRPDPPGAAQPARRPAVRRPPRHREGRPGAVADAIAAAAALAAARRRGPTRWRSTRCWSEDPRSRPSTRSSPGEKSNPKSLSRTALHSAYLRNDTSVLPGGRHGTRSSRRTHRARRAPRRRADQGGGLLAVGAAPGTQRALLDAGPRGLRRAGLRRRQHRRGGPPGRSSWAASTTTSAASSCYAWQEHQAAHEEAARTARAGQAGGRDRPVRAVLGRRAGLPDGSWQRRDWCCCSSRRRPARLRADEAASRPRMDRAERHRCWTCRRTRSTGSTRAS